MARHPMLRLAMACCVYFITTSGAASAEDRYAAMVMNAATGDVLYEEQADEPRYPASLAKMMTLYLLFDAIQHRTVRLEDTLIASAAAAAQPPSRLGLQEGDQITVQDAILALVVCSANDVATVVAERIGGSEEHFAALMTQRARALGLAHTRFANASGLPDPAQSTTARDMARLGRALWTDFPGFYRYFQTADFNWSTLRMRNHNHLLRQVDGVDGIKTGYTRASGFNIVSSARRNGQRVIVVVMGGATAAERDAQAAYLIDAAFERNERRHGRDDQNTAISIARQSAR